MFAVCQDNEFINSHGNCEECPPGEEPMVDHKSCMDCPDDKISSNGICMECTDATLVPNIAMTACVGMLNLIQSEITILLFINFFKE